MKFFINMMLFIFILFNYIIFVWNFEDTIYYEKTLMIILTFVEIITIWIAFYKTSKKVYLVIVVIGFVISIFIVLSMIEKLIILPFLIQAFLFALLFYLKVRDIKK